MDRSASNTIPLADTSGGSVCGSVVDPANDSIDGSSTVPAPMAIARPNISRREMNLFI
jgi:hypothetical protein